MDVAKIPFIPTLASQVSGPPSPGAMRAVNDTVTIFDFELYLARIDDPFAGRASEKPTGGMLC